MAIEVIDLLSSDNAPSSPDHPIRQLANPRQPARGLESIPPNLVAGLRELAGPSQVPASRALERTAGGQYEVNGVVILSDDFDTTWDQDDLGVDLSGPAHKRPRLSERQTSPRGQPSGVGRSISSIPTTSHARPLQQTAPRRQASAPEPIDFSSSPFPQAAVARATVRYDPNLFVSSSPAPVSKAVDPRLDEFERNPFASSSPHPRQVLAKKVPEWDPISSSAPQVCLDNAAGPRRAPVQRSRSEVIAIYDSDDDQRPMSSDDEFPDIADVDLAKVKAKAPVVRKPLGAIQSKASSKSRPSGSKAAADRVRGTENRAANREAEKQRKQREKEQAKQKKAAEKQRAAALAEVNKIRTDKKISTPEMIVDLPATLGEIVRLQAETLLKDLDVQVSTCDSPVDNVIKWRRKVKSRYNDEMGHWEPIPMRIEAETYAMAIVPATDFVQLATDTDGADLAAHVLKMRQHYPEHTLIYMIEGLTPWMRNNRNIRNRQFVSAVRNGLEDETAVPSSGQPRARRRKNNTAQHEYIDEDAIEDALLQLQVLHSALIHHTNAPVETAQWIAVFTQHISTVPYRRQREQTNAATAAFCMETGQVRTGDGPKDTYVRMLQEIARVTAPIAYGIASEFETVTELVKGLENKGPLLLEGVRKSANKDGALSDRTVGQAVSRRLYKIFTGRDEMSMDV